MTDDIARLHRHIRALAAVNHQLHTQLERTAPDSSSSLRSAHAKSWLEQLEASPRTDDIELVRTPDGSMWIVEGQVRREVRSGVISAVLALHQGGFRQVGHDELDDCTDGAPVEMFEGPRSAGAPFLVLGGRRFALRGMPLPHPVGLDDVRRIPEGPDLDVAAINPLRAQKEPVHLTRTQRLKSAIARDGLLGAVRSATRRATRERRGEVRQEPGS